MPRSLDARIDSLPKAQQEIWPLLAPARDLSLVLYGGTAVALHLGHRVSIDFDFFSAAPLDKKRIETSLAFMRGAATIQEDENTLVVNAAMPSGRVKVSLFGGISIGRINAPLRTRDQTLLVASLEEPSGDQAQGDPRPRRSEGLSRHRGDALRRRCAGARSWCFRENVRQGAQ